MKDLIREVEAKIETAVRRLGFVRRHKSGPLTVEISAGIVGRLGLPRATRRTRDTIFVGPAVGLRHEHVEQLLSQLVGTRQRPSAVSPTITTNIGYVMPERRYLEWEFGPEGDLKAGAEDLAQAVERYGLPFMKEHGSLPGIIDALHQFGVRIRSRYTLPVAAYLNDGPRAAVSELERFVEAMKGAPTSAAAERFLAFAETLRRRMMEASL